MPITEQGYEIKRFADIVSEINADQISNLAADLNTSPETVLGVITNIFATSISSQEELNQAVSDNFNIDKAEGKYLDDLVALIGVSRLEESPSNGTLEVTGTQGATIPLTATFTDGVNTLTPSVASTITQSSCVKATYSLDSVIVGFNYTLKIGFDLYVYEAISGDTVDDVITSLISLSLGNTLATVSLDQTNSHMVIETKQELSPITLFVGSKFVVEAIVSLVDVSNNVNGSIEIEKGTVTAFTGTTGVDSVINSFDFIIGRGVETDEELRVRTLLPSNVTGNATIPAIKARLLAIQGVTSVDIIENTEIVNDSEGRPPYSYESIITGGSTKLIAETLFDSKPAGIRTYGDILGVVYYEGIPYDVYFSRPTPVYAWVKISYTIYDEEIFPANGDDLIKQAITDYGDSLGNGVDIIPKRFYSPLYSSIDGLNDLNITIAINEDIQVTPEAGDYQSGLISVDRGKFGNFNIERVEII